VLGGLEGFACVIGGEQEDEFFAAKAGDDVVLATMCGLEDAGELDEHLVASDVAMGIVEVLEVIDVGHDERDGGAIEGGLMPCCFEAGVEVTAVGKTGEAVAEGERVEIIVEARELFGAELFAEEEDVGEAVGELDAVVGDGGEDGAAGDEGESADLFAVGEKEIVVEVGGVGDEESGDEGEVEGQPHAKRADGGEEKDEVDLGIDAGDSVVDRSCGDAAGRGEKADSEADELIEDGVAALAQEMDGERGAGGEDAVADDGAVPDVDRV
jgi:hypothetical protein